MVVKIEIGTVSTEHAHVSVEAKSQNQGCLVSKDSSKHLIQLLRIAQSNQVNEKDLVEASNLQKRNAFGLVLLGHLRPPLRVNPDHLLANQDFHFLDCRFITNKLNFQIFGQSQMFGWWSAHWLKQIFWRFEVFRLVILHVLQVFSQTSLVSACLSVNEVCLCQFVAQVDSFGFVRFSSLH